MAACACLKVNALVVYEDKFVITGSDDGAVRMWSADRREQTLQFLVMNHVCVFLSHLLISFVVACNSQQ